MREQSGEVLFERCEPVEDAKAMGGGEGVSRKSLGIGI